MGSIRGFSSIRSKAGFNRVYKQGRYAHASSLVVYFQKYENNFFGVVASKKVGNAVYRNRAKRRLRALFTELRHSLEVGHYVVVAKVAISELSYTQLKEELLIALKRVNALEKL